MGFFDTMKDKASALASDAGRASKVTAAQARVVVLQNEVRKAERELGHAAFDLIERGELEPAATAEAAEADADADKASPVTPASAATTRAMRLPAEPLTRTTSPLRTAPATSGASPVLSSVQAPRMAAGKPGINAAV